MRRLISQLRVSRAAFLMAGSTLCAQTSAPGAAAEAPAASLPEYGQVVWHEAGGVFGAPLHWDGDNWLEFGAAAVGVVGTAVLLDHTVHEAAQRNHGSGVEHFANNFEKFGAEYSFGVLGIAYLEGWAAHDPRNRLVAEDGLAASLFSGVITYAIKETVGRSRPKADRGTHHFSPFSANASFPSGHATQAFAVASVIAARYDDNLWIDVPAYGIAGLVGVARIDHNTHFASDVLAGGIIGTVVGRTVVHYRTSAHRPVTFAPFVAPHLEGAMLEVKF
jgi:membrane-associated phospholipid phosphatase